MALPGLIQHRRIGSDGDGVRVAAVARSNIYSVDCSSCSFSIRAAMPRAERTEYRPDAADAANRLDD